MKRVYSNSIVSFILGLALVGARHCAMGQLTNGPCAPTLSVNSLSASSFSFNITDGGTGQRIVWSTSDLTTPLWNWDFRGTITLNGSPQVFTDNTVSNVMYRFYKIATTNGDCCTRAIGFIRLDVLPGTTSSPGANAWIANQLYAPANTLNGLFNPMADGGHLPTGSTIIKWDADNFMYLYYTWDGSSWGSDGSVNLNPGESAYLVHSLSNAFRVSFAGLVQDGTANLALPASTYNFISSTVPRSGGVQSVLGYPPHVGDVIGRWTGGPGNTTYEYTSTGWSPSQPSIRIGEGFYQFNSTLTNNWQIDFSGCPYVPPF